MGRKRGKGYGLEAPAAPIPLGEVLDAWLKQSGLGKRFDLATVVDEWAELVGPQIAAVTRALSVTPDGTLMVRVATHGWATELGLMTPKILARVNGSKRGRVQHVRWMVGPLDRP